MASRSSWLDDMPTVAAVGGVCLAAGAAAGWVLARRAGHKATPTWYREQRTSGMAKELFEYCESVGTRTTPQHQAINAYTQELGGISRMCISGDEGQFIETLGKVMGAKTAVEVGCFTGYGSLSLARGCTGRVFTLDVSEEHLPQARRQWDAAGVGARIEHIKGPAADSMRLLRCHGVGEGAAAAVREGMRSGSRPAVPAGAPGEGQVDLVFVDADKASYADYVEQAHALLRRGGVCLVDNTIWSGRVISSLTDKDTTAVKKLNADLHKDERWDISLVPIADGVTILRKR